MTQEFIPYEQALALEELGFDEPCIATIDQTEFIHIKGTEYPIRGDMWYNTIDAPLYQQAFRWFREKCGLNYIIKEVGQGRFEATVYKGDGWATWDFGYKFNTYGEAELACLKKLIEIIKNK